MTRYERAPAHVNEISSIRVQSVSVSCNVAVFRLSDTSEPPTDKDLIERTLGGDSNAFAVLVERFQRKVFRVAFAIVRDDVEADSVTQDAFVQAYTNLAKFQGRAEFETWLTRIAINRARDVLRRRRFVSLFAIGEDGRSPDASINSACLEGAPAQVRLVLLAE